MNLAKIMYGSKMYGTDNINSDTDYKVIYLPDLDDLIMGQKPKIKNNTTNQGKNTSEDTDVEKIPLQKFVGAFISGQAYAIELVEAVNSGTAKGAMKAEFKDLCKKLHLMIPTDLRGMVGYALKQHYEYKASATNKVMLQELLTVIIKSQTFVRNVGDFADSMEEEILALSAKFSNKVSLSEVDTGGTNFKYMEVMGKRFPYEITLKEAQYRLHTMIDSYGSRTKGFDYKSIHHALRVITQVTELHKNGGFSYPLPNTELLINVKAGVYSEEECQSLLDKYVAGMYEAEKNSVLPDVSPEVIESYALRTIKKMYGLNS